MKGGGKGNVVERRLKLVCARCVWMNVRMSG